MADPNPDDDPTAVGTDENDDGGETDLLPAREEVVGAGVAWAARWTGRLVVLAIGAFVLGLVVERIWSILLPLILGLVVTTLLEPPARVLRGRARFSRTLAAATVVLGAVVVIVLTFTFVGTTIAAQIGDVVSSAADGIDEVVRLAGQAGIDVSQSQIDQALTTLQDRLQSSATTIASGVLVGVGAVTTGLVNLVLTLVLAFFFVKDGQRFVPWVGRTAGPTAGPHLMQVLHGAWRTLGGFIRTQALVGLIDAVLIGAGLLVVGVPLVVPLAVLTFVAAFAPIVGAVTVGVLAVLVALVSNGWVAALIIAGVVLLVQQLEGNVLLPWLQGQSLHLHAAVVLLSIVLGSTLFGVAGAFLAVPVAAVAADVLRYLNGVVTRRSRPAPGGGPGAGSG